MIYSDYHARTDQSKYENKLPKQDCMQGDRMGAAVAVSQSQCGDNPLESSSKKMPAGSNGAWSFSE